MDAATRLDSLVVESVRLHMSTRWVYQHCKIFVNRPVTCIVPTATSHVSGQEMKDLSITLLEQINMSEMLPRAFTVVRSLCEIEWQQCRVSTVLEMTKHLAFLL